MNILLLGGSHEARQIASRLANDHRVSLQVSIARADTWQWPERCEVRVGGFGSGKEFESWLGASRITHVIDATHPFAIAMTGRLAQALRHLDLDAVRILRPEWVPTQADRWIFLDQASDAAGHIPQGACAFLATGRRDLDRFGNLSDCRLLARVKSEAAGAFPFPNGGFIYGPGPFTVAGERALFKREKVNWIVTQNSGGDGGWPKLAAARALGLPVAMIRRPPMPLLLVVETVDAAIEWVRCRL